MNDALLNAIILTVGTIGTFAFSWFFRRNYDMVSTNGARARPERKSTRQLDYDDVPLGTGERILRELEPLHDEDWAWLEHHQELCGAYAVVSRNGNITTVRANRFLVRR